MPGNEFAVDGSGDGGRVMAECGDEFREGGRDGAMRRAVEDEGEGGGR